MLQKPTESFLVQFNIHNYLLLIAVYSFTIYEDNVYHKLNNLVGIFWPVNNNNNTLVLMWIGVADYKHKPLYTDDVFMYSTRLSLFAITW